MPRPDRSKVINLFEEDIIDPVAYTASRTSAAKKSPAKNKAIPTGANNTNKSRFLVKLEDEMFHEFDYKDWFQYFVWKFEQHNKKYLCRNYAKEYAILKSIMNELPWSELKNMIDFIFDSGQDIADKRTVGLWVLSKGWINSIYQNTQLWMEGKYKPKNAPARNREWVAEASRKESGTGIRYGSKVVDEEPEDKPVKKKSVTIGWED